MRMPALLAACYGLMAVSFVNAGHSFWIPSIAVDLRMAEAAAALLLSCAFWGMTAAIVLVGPLAERYGYRVIFLAGLGTGAVPVAAYPLAFRLYPDSREKLAYILGGSCSVGPVLIAALGMVLLNAHWSWRWARGSGCRATSRRFPGPRE